MKRTKNITSKYIKEVTENGIFDALGEIISIQDTDFKVLYQNRRHREIVGDRVGEYCYMAYQRRDSVCARCHLAMVFKDGNVHRSEQKLITDRGHVYVEVTGSPLKDAQGRVIAGIEIAREVTERKRIESELLKFKFFSDNSSDAHFLLGKDARFQYVNKQACRILGYSEYELLKLSVFDVDVVYSREKYEALFDLIQEKSVPPIETVNKRKDGTLFPSEITVTGYQIDGKPYMFAALRDITGRKRTEDEILNIAKGVSATVGEKFFSSMAKHLANILDADYAYIAEFYEDKPNFVHTLSLIADGKSIDNIEVDLTGTPCETLLKETICTYPSNIQKLFPRAFMMAEMNVEGYAGTLLTGLSGERLGLMAVMYRRPIENVARVESTLKIFAARAAAEIERKRSEQALRKAHDELEMRVRERTTEIQKINKELIAEITKHRQTEKSLRESEDKYRRLSLEFHALLDAIPDNLILLSPELKILWANKAFASGYKKKGIDLRGKHCYRLCCNISEPCKNCPVVKSFKSGDEETSQVINSEGRVFDKRAFPLKNDSGKVKNVIEVTRDITARVHMEEEAKLVQSRLIHANKMTSLGTLVSGVAHEINNPNSFIMNNAQVLNEVWKDIIDFLSKSYRNDKDLSFAGIPFKELRKIVPELLVGINEGSLRIKNVVDNLINFSRPDKASLDGKVNVNTVIMTSTSILENQIKRFTKNFHVKCEDNMPVVRGSAQQIEQVIINLIMNALQALPNKKAGVWIHTAHNKRSNHVEIKIKDEGVGIPNSILDRITEPFFTTKLDTGGTGLGLSISYAIVKAHKGSLTFKSKEGKGTTVSVRLPVY